jgi:serine/threonine-protein kinase
MNSIGPYQIEQLVAEGGLSTVYAALDPRSGRRVAIKVAKTTTDSPDHAWIMDRFRRESFVLATLKHPAIASISDQGVLPDGSPYLVSDWIEGSSLDQILRAKFRIPLPSALFIAEQVAGALGAAHSLGFVHSDVKPTNIFIQDQNPSAALTVKLLDFGVAGELANDTHETRAGVLIGTPHYMSPEQLRAEALSPSSDVWALGVVLFEMLTGSRPFTGLSGIVSAQVKIPEDANLPPSVAAFLMDCLNKDPKLRPANGDEAAKEIRRLRLELTPEIDLRPAGEIFAQPAASSAVPRPTVAPIPELHPRFVPTPSGSLRLFAVTATLIALAGVSFFFLRHTRLSPSPWTGIAVGIGLALGGAMLGRAIQKLLVARHRAISTEVQDVLNGARTARHLSQTLAIQVDDLVSKCRLVDEKILATTMAVMVEEYSSARAFDDRQKALMNAVALLEKLMPKLSPWYVRHDKLIGFVVTLVGLLSGLTTVVQNLAKLTRGM